MKNQTKKVQDDIKKVLETYLKADKTTKESMEDIFGKKMFEEKKKKSDSYNLTYIQLWDSFLKESKLKIKLPFSRTTKDREEQRTNAHHMLNQIVPFYNKGWEADWENGNEYKYFPRFYMGKGCSSGFGFEGSDTYGWVTYAIVGSRLCSQSHEICEAVAKKYLAVYKIFISK